MKNNKTTETSQIQEMLQTYRKKLAKEAWLKSVLCGATVGFALNFACSAVLLFSGDRYFWLCIVAFLVGTLVSTPLFYFAKFKQSTRQVASRVDTLGLEERILTMAQFENDDSYMARRQREDAMESLKTINSSLIRFAISIPMILICVISCLISVGTTTAAAMTPQGLFQIIEESKPEPPKTYYNVLYSIKDENCGRIEGVLLQKVENGQQTTPVEAVPDDDYIFAGWSDGITTPMRIDTVDGGDIEVYAIFQPVEDNEVGDGEGNGDGEGEGEGDSSEHGEPGNPAPSPITPSNPSDPSDTPGDGDSPGGSSSPDNQVVDGDTFVGDVYGDSLSDAQDSVNGNGSLGDSESGIIGDYFSGIAK